MQVIHYFWYQLWILAGVFPLFLTQAAVLCSYHLPGNYYQGNYQRKLELDLSWDCCSSGTKPHPASPSYLAKNERWKNREAVGKARNSDARKHPREGVFFRSGSTAMCLLQWPACLEPVLTHTESHLGVICWKCEPPAKCCDKQQLPFSLQIYLQWNKARENDRNWEWLQSTPVE